MLFQSIIFNGYTCVFFQFKDSNFLNFASIFLFTIYFQLFVINNTVINICRHNVFFLLFPSDTFWKVELLNHSNVLKVCVFKVTWHSKVTGHLNWNLEMWVWISVPFPNYFVTLVKWVCCVCLRFPHLEYKMAKLNYFRCQFCLSMTA